ncbi:MAG: hypothetical protein H6604_07365 [Flavobacteriales bacterium]|nr:hypothetical protein [Flavobacteriales bacterium]
MEVKKVSRKNLDLKKYSDCLKKSINYRIYAEVWYLDLLTDSSWFCYVLDDYKAVMPIPYKSYLGIKVVTQPNFCQQLGIFYSSEISEKEFKLLYSRFRKNIIRCYNFNEENSTQFTIKGKEKNNQLLQLNQAYEGISKLYQKDRKKDIRRITRQNLYLSREIGISETIKKIKNNYSFVKNSEFKELECLLELIHEKDELLQYSLFKDNELICSAFFIKSKTRMILLASIKDFSNDYKGAFAYLLDVFIQEHSEKELILDFEGSMLLGVAKFNSSFGAVTKKYITTGFSS